MKFCIQWNINCDTDNNAGNCLNGIDTAISAITTSWGNENNKNINQKNYSCMENKYKVTGIQRLSNNAEKDTLINKIKGMGNPPFITGYVQYHLCNHDEDTSPCTITKRWDF